MNILKSLTPIPPKIEVEIEPQFNYYANLDHDNYEVKIFYNEVVAVIALPNVQTFTFYNSDKCYADVSKFCITRLEEKTISLEDYKYLQSLEK